MIPIRVITLDQRERRSESELRRQSVGLALRASTAIAEGPDAAVLVAVENLVTGFPRDLELGAQRRHLLALEQAGHKPEALVHDVTLPSKPRPLRGEESQRPPDLAEPRCQSDRLPSRAELLSRRCSFDPYGEYIRVSGKRHAVLPVEIAERKLRDSLQRVATRESHLLQDDHCAGRAAGWIL
jgi:hypothetical protein